MKTNTLDCFQAIADPYRREILMMLSKDRLPINSLADNFSISRPAVSKHIKVLHNAGFITIEDKGRERYCVLNEAGFNEVKQWIEFFEHYWNKKIMNLEKVLKKEFGDPKDSQK